MEIFGKIICALPIRSGVSAKSGKPWQCASYVLETQDQYPKRMVFDVFGQDNISDFNIQVGKSLTVCFDIDAREYQPSVLPPVGAPGSALSIPTPPPPSAAPAAPAGGSDGLPF